MTIHSPNTPYPSMAFLFDALVAPVKLAVLEAAIELDMARILSTTGRVDEIAEKAGIQTGTPGLVCFLDAMVAVGLADKENNRYSNTDVGKYFFDPKSPVYMGDYIKSMKALVQDNLAGMAEIVKKRDAGHAAGRILAERIPVETRWFRIWHLASVPAWLPSMRIWSRNCRSSTASGKSLTWAVDPGSSGPKSLTAFPVQPGC